jgi:formylglycine-generating enzyme required for sulfatase activity
VEEWCLDLFMPDITSYTLDPVGPPTSWSGNRVFRSGDCCEHASGCRAAARSSMNPGNQMSEDGFRAVLIP